jgi:hypothetical protein
MVLYSIDWYDIDYWGSEVYIYTTPIGDGHQQIANGLPEECIINAVYSVLTQGPLRLISTFLNQPFWFEFRFRDNTQELCGYEYPNICGAQVIGSLINVSTGQVQGVTGQTVLTIFKEML